MRFWPPLHNKNRMLRLIGIRLPAAVLEMSWQTFELFFGGEGVAHFVLLVDLGHHGIMIVVVRERSNELCGESQLVGKRSF